MKQLDDAQTALAIRAAEHFEAHLRVMRRDNVPFVAFLDHLKKRTRQRNGRTCSTRSQKTKGLKLGWRNACL